MSGTKQIYRPVKPYHVKSVSSKHHLFWSRSWYIRDWADGLSSVWTVYHPLYLIFLFEHDDLYSPKIICERVSYPQRWRKSKYWNALKLFVPNRIPANNIHVCKLDGQKVSWDRTVRLLYNIFFITQWNPPIVFPIDHDDVIKWKHFPRYWPFVRGIHRSPKGQWGGTLMFSLICALNIRLSKLSWSWRFETPSRPLWRHCNDPLPLPWRGDMGFHYEFKVWSKFTCVFRTVTLCATSCYEWAC